jgi:anti-sigma factor RsiW
MPHEEDLVAYLDGELDGESSRRIEELLSAHPSLRLTLQQLDRTWELLDTLDKPQPAERFTRSTLEMVTAAAVEDVEEGRTPAARRRRTALAGASLLAAALAGFLAVYGLWPDPNRQLLEDLPVLENLDEYRQVDDIEFLRMLRQEGLFAGEQDAAEDDSPGAPASGLDSGV